MARIHGKGGVVMVGGQVVGSVESWTVNYQVATDDASAQGDDGTYHVTGLPDWSGSITCRLDQENAVQEGMTPGTAIEVDLYEAGNAAGKKYWTGNASIAGMDVNVPLGTVMRTFNIKGQGALSRETVGES